MSRARFLLPLALFALLCAVVLPAAADSHARIVRLSYISGDVQMDRALGNGFEKAILNMPVVYHSHIRTGEDGEAEIEFENGSTVRLTPDTEIDVNDLSITTAGEKVTSLLLNQGLAFVEWKHSDGARFDVQFGGHDLTLRKSAHLRIQTAPDASIVALYKGEAQVTGGAQGPVDVHKGETLTLDSSDDRYFLAKSIETGPYDTFDHQRDSERQVMVAQQDANSYLGNSFYGGDLGYYGTWFNSPYGDLWRPFGYGVGWSPFDYGSWAFYQGTGWNFVSGYPWGWLPYHYGNWVYVNGYGWGWRRPHHWGSFSAYNGLRSGALNAYSGSASAPVAAAIPRPPAYSGVAGRSTLVTAGAGSSAPFVDPRGILIKKDAEALGAGFVPRSAVRSGTSYSSPVAATRPGLVTAQGAVHPPAVANHMPPVGGVSRLDMRPMPAPVMRSSPGFGGTSSPHYSSPPMHMGGGMSSGSMSSGGSHASSGGRPR